MPVTLPKSSASLVKLWSWSPWASNSLDTCDMAPATSDIDSGTPTNTPRVEACKRFRASPVAPVSRTSSFCALSMSLNAATAAMPISFSPSVTPRVAPSLPNDLATPLPKESICFSTPRNP